MASLTIEDKVNEAAGKLANALNNVPKESQGKPVQQELIAKVILESVNKTDDQYRAEALAKLTPTEKKALVG